MVINFSGTFAGEKISSYFSTVNSIAILFSMPLRDQLKNITPILIIVFAAATALLSIVIMMGIENDIELDHFTQDPAAITGSPFYTGFFSNIGILLWCASAAFCFFSGIALPRTQQLKNLKSYLFYSGLITALLMLDDLFLLHENVFPDYIGIPENAVLLIYANIILLYLLLFRELLFRTEYLLLGLAFVLIGISTVVDLVPMPIPEDSFLEDAVKLFGIICWFIYFLRLGYKSVKVLL